MIQGFCPNCDASGSVGEACAERICQRKDYRFIPAEHHAKLTGDRARETDPMLGQMVGDYLLVGVLGQGGFGKVYLALQSPLWMPAALKLLTLNSIDPSMRNILVDKFMGEAQALAALAHPNIVRLLKFGEWSDKPYLVMEFVRGARTLKAEVSSRIAAGSTLRLKDAKHVLGQILNGLEAAHLQKIIHRDIKPENVMLQRIAGDEFFVRLVDFGLAKFVEERSRSSHAMGTPMYMAPEQLRKSSIGPWTDFYALGVIAFELLTGKRPYPGDSHHEILGKKLQVDYVPTSVIPDDAVTPSARKFFKKALAIDPEERYRNAAEFRQGLEALFDDVDGESGADESTMMLDGMEALVDPAELMRLRNERDELQAMRQQLDKERAAFELEKGRASQEMEAIKQSEGSDEDGDEKTAALPGLSAAKESAAPDLDDEMRTEVTMDVSQLKQDSLSQIVIAEDSGVQTKTSVSDEDAANEAPREPGSTQYLDADAAEPGDGWADSAKKSVRPPEARDPSPSETHPSPWEHEDTAASTGSGAKIAIFAVAVLLVGGGIGVGLSLGEDSGKSDSNIEVVSQSSSVTNDSRGDSKKSQETVSEAAPSPAAQASKTSQTSSEKAKPATPSKPEMAAKVETPQQRQTRLEAMPPSVGNPPVEATQLPSGVAYMRLKTGPAERKAKVSAVRVRWTSWKKGDVKWGETYEAKGDLFPVRQAIKGLREAFGLMGVGEKIRVWIPAKLAYGIRGRDEGIPYGPLVFDLELLGYR